ncbi:MAG TPA: PfkB family carbohydrate kinase [Ilumatobacteraceae bacterium]|nr:PfkB family carbohydrate kinase [Ilumatobacteraceae bacterium]
MLATLGDLVEDVIVRLDGPVNIASDTPASISRRRGGSAANTAVAAAHGGHPARFLGQVGTDAIGGALLDEMARAGVDTSCARRAGSTGTIVALVDAAGERSMLTDRRTCVELVDPDPAWLDGVTVLHVPFYSLALEPIATTATTLMGWSRDRAIPVSVDLSSTAVMHDFGLARVRALIAHLSPAVILANRDETAAFGTHDLPTGSMLIEKRGPDSAIVHHGSAAIEVPALAIGAVGDTTGAGDAFTAGFLTHPGGWHADPVAACAAGHRAAAALLTSRARP